MSKEPHKSTDAGGWMAARMVAVTVALLACFGTIGWRLHQVQVEQHALWAERGQKLLKEKRILTAFRGPIVDRNGKLLASDEMVKDLWLCCGHLRDFNDVRQRLADLQGCKITELSARMSRDEINAAYRAQVFKVVIEGLRKCGSSVEDAQQEVEAAFATGKHEIVLRKELLPAQVASWNSLLKTGNIGPKGSRVGSVELRSRLKRFYPATDRLAHVIGCVNVRHVDIETGEFVSDEELAKSRRKVRRVEIGAEGIEARMNALLTGADGHRWIENDVRDEEITMFRGETVEAVDGHEVWLTIDMRLQHIVEDVLDEAMARHKPERMIALIVNPTTGEVLAMANRPEIERDKTDGMTSNLAVMGKYEPGSVFKVVTYATAFDAKATWMEEMLNCDPSQRLLEKMKITDHCNGRVSVLEAFAASSNRAAYLLAHRVGEKRFIESVNRFGFGRPSGINLTGEVAGTIHRPGTDTWDGLTFSRMAYGHAIEVTPLQMCMAVAAIANGGQLMKPQIIKEVRDAHGGPVREFPPETVRRVCSAQAAALVRKGMVAVIDHPKGTAPEAAIPGVTVAGKTGTAQLYRKDGKGIWDGHYCVSFAGFAPAENPQLCAIVVVDDPKLSTDGITGGKLAAPIFAQLMERSLHSIALVNAGRPTADATSTGGGQ